MILPAGVFRDEFFSMWQKADSHAGQIRIPGECFGPAGGEVLAVDGPSAHPSADSAVAGHAEPRGSSRMWGAFRSGTAPGRHRQVIFAERSPASYLSGINRLRGSPFYTHAGCVRCLSLARRALVHNKHDCPKSW